MPLRAPRRIAALLAVPALLATGVAVAAPGADAATSDPTYKGSALALSVKVNLAGSSILDEILPELVTYPPGSKKTLIELPAELAELVGLKVLNASSEVSGGVLASNAHTTGLSVLGEVITAKVLNADCTANQGDVTGDSQVAGLTLAGSKVPVDPGPNLKIELPAALAALVQGSIVIDEQTETEDGGLRIRALHINLVVAPTAIDDALNSVIRTVRETAEQLKAVVEEVTGQSLDELVGKAAPAKAKAKGAKSADQDEVRASVAAKKAQQAQQAPAAPAEVAAPAAPAQAAAPAPAAAPAEKTDGADLDSEATSDQQAETEAAIAAESAEAAQAEQATEADESTQDAAAAERAERAEKGSKAEQEAAAAEAAAPTSTDPTVATEAAPAAPAPAAAPKAQGSDLPVVDKAVSAIPSADSIAGALGVDIVVSQVICEGAPGVASVDELPGTGGNGNVARNIAVTGLGLLAAGGAALVLTRRRRSFGSIA